jgi:hypothetical protein
MPPSSRHLPTFHLRRLVSPPAQAAGAGRAWRPASGGLGDGGASWPPAAYAWDPAYYPAASAPALASITINANGPGSTNYFNVAGPQARYPSLSESSWRRALSASL